MSKKQIELLRSKGFEVLDELNFIKPCDTEPNIKIIYNEILKKFELSLASTTLNDSVVEEFILILLERGRLIKQLNSLGDEK